ncbi:MAG: adenosine deaminase [Oscillospiraceae bacterium]|nr:adenosine deaminase [Oscillospiraceae bacterium]
MQRYPFPKTELHCHLDGAILPQTLFELATERGLPLPGNAKNPEELTPFVVYGPDCVSVNTYLERFELPTQILQDKEALERCAYELVVRLHDLGHIYTDIRFAPQLHTRRGMTQREAIEAVRAGIDRGLEETSHEIVIGLIVCCMCVGTADLNHEANLETARLAVEYHDKSVVQAMDLAGAEGFCHLTDFADLFEIANKGGCPITCHAGDSQEPVEIRTAIEVFGSKRIGHGHHIINDPQLIEEAKERGVTLEICPTSNVQCLTQPSYEAHPIKRLFDMGLHVTVNTDNPVIAGVTVEDEYDHLKESLGFTDKELVRMNLYAIDVAFCSEEEKARLREKFVPYL